MKVTVRATNVSHHVITLDGASILPNGGNPALREVDQNGEFIGMPSQFLDYPVLPSSRPTQIPLAPGQTVSRTLNVILWTPYLQAAVSTAPTVVQSTSILHLHLIAADPPRVNESSSNGQLVATVQRPRGVAGRLFYRSSVYCQISPSTAAINEVPAMANVLQTRCRTTATRFVPPSCPASTNPAAITGWRLIIGWRNHSVAVVTYGGPTP